MRKFKIPREYIFLAAVFFLYFVFALLFWSENPSRILVVGFSLLLFILSFAFTKNLLFSSFLYILIILPFNITYQIPEVVSIFNTELTLSNPYVNGIYVNYLVPTLSILDIGVVLCLFSFLFNFGKTKLFSILRGYGIFLPIFVGFLLLQNLFLADPLSIFNSLRFVLYIIFLLLSIEWFKESGRQLLKGVLLVSIPIVLVQGALGIIQFTRGSSLGFTVLGESQVVSGMLGSSFVTLGGEVFLRAYGTFPHPNILAGFLVLNILLGLYLLQIFKNRGRILSIGLICLSGIALLFTFSRIAILLSIFVLLVYFGLKISKKRFFSFSGVLLLERFTNLLSSGDTSWSDRVNLAKSSFLVIKQRWLLGSGVGEFVSAMKDSVPRTLNGIQLLQPVHNFFLLTLAELGAFGFVSLMGLICKVFVRNTKRFTLFKGLVLVSILVLISFDHYAFSLPQGIGIFVLLVLVYTFRE